MRRSHCHFTVAGTFPIASLIQAHHRAEMPPTANETARRSPGWTSGQPGRISDVKSNDTARPHRTMTQPFSIQTLTALTEVVTGGSANDSSPSIGHYRSGPKLERFFGALNVSMRIRSTSRIQEPEQAESGRFLNAGSGTTTTLGGKGPRFGPGQPRRDVG